MNIGEFTKDYIKFYGQPLDKQYLDDILEKNLQHNGKSTELVIIMEELAELTQQVSKKFRCKEDPMHLLEEVADVYICLEELKLIAEIYDDEVEAAMSVKLDRIRKRLERPSSIDDYHEHSGLLDE